MRIYNLRIVSFVVLYSAALFIYMGCGSSSITDFDDTDDSSSITTPYSRLTASAYSGAAPLVVSFAASAQNFPAGAVLTYDYDFDNDGVFELQNAGATPPQHTFASPGTYKVGVRIRCSSGVCATRTVLIEVVSSGTQPPSHRHYCPVASATATPGTVNAGQAVTLNGSASYDTDGTIVKYDWDTNGDGVYELTNSSARPPAVTFTQQGTFYVSLRVTDNDGLTATAPAKVVVSQGGGQQDGAPHVTLQAYPSSGPAPLTVALDASDSWADNGGVLKYDWDYTGDGTFDVIAGAETVTYLYQSAGTYHPAVRVTDTAQKTTTKTIVVTVTAGAEQIHAQLYVYPTTGAAPLIVTLDANGSWAIDGSALTYEFDPEGDGTYLAGVAQPMTTHVYAQAGTFTPMLRVRDTTGRTAETSGAAVTVTGGTTADSPVARIVATPKTGAVPLTVAFDATSSTDPNNDIVNYMFDFQTDGTYDVNSASGKASHIYSTAGAFNATVLVRDAQGHTSTATTQVVVAAPTSGPVVTLEAFPNGGPVPLSVELDASGSWSGNGLTLTYDWDYEGDGTYNLLHGAATVSHLYTVVGTYHPTVRVTDSASASATKSTTVNATPGQEQIHAQMYASPTSGTAPLLVYLEANGSWSIDGAAQTYEYDPEGDGTYLPSTTNLVITHTYTQAGVYTPRLKVSDAKGRTASASGPQITVSAPPSVAPVAKLQAVPQSGSAPLLVNFDARGSTDANNDIVSYAFDFTTDGTYDVTNSTGTTSSTYNMNGTYTATVLVKDAANHTAAATVQISVGTAPSGGPSAIVLASSYSSPAPATITYYAGYSFSEGSAIKSFDWDLNNDGVYEKLDAGPEQTVTYPTAGTYKIKVRVTDYKSRQAVCDCEIIVT